MSKEFSRGASRRQVLAGALALSAISSKSFAEPSGGLKSNSNQFLVGSWVRDKILPLNPLSGSIENNDWSFGSPYTAITNVFHGYSFPRSQRVYLALNTGGMILRAKIGSDGRLIEEGRWSAGAGEPSFMDGDRTGKFLAVANFNANVTVFRDGDTPTLIANKVTTGHGPLPRQESPHFHGVKFSPDNRFLYACDMGGDQVLAYPFDARAGTVGEQILAFKMGPASGPRHILFHANGRYAYVLNELDSTIGTFGLNPTGQLTLLAMQTCMPDPVYIGYNHGGHIEIDQSGRFLYVSNRGQNSIGVFAIGDDGSLVNRQWIQSGGDWPWYFHLSRASELLVANQRTNNVTVFKINADGTLVSTGRSLAVNAPAFIMEISG